jgi:hypothetical protein
MAVVTAIGDVPVDSFSKPLTPVIMHSVSIRRVGAAAEAFDVNAWGLPTVAGANPRLLRSGTQFALQFPRAIYHDYTLFHSGDLHSWEQKPIGLYINTPPTENFDVTATTVGQSQQFYRVPRVSYPGPIYTPQTVLGTKVRLVFSATQFVDLFLTGNTTGTFTFTDSNGTRSGKILKHSWAQEAYRGRLICEFDTLLDPILADLVFVDGGSGSYKGTYYSRPQQAIAGAFSLTPIPQTQSSTISTERTARRLSRRMQRQR